MRSVWVIVFFTVLIFLSACLPMDTTPTVMLAPSRLPQASTAARVTDTVPDLSDVEEKILPTFTRTPIYATRTAEVQKEFSVTTPQPLTITILYDNNSYDPRLTTAWGFSALVEHHDHTLLFDTGGDGKLLLENMRSLKVDTTRIEGVVLSHAHGDHTGGLMGVLNTGVKPVVYLLPSFPSAFKSQVAQLTQVSEVAPRQEISDGLWTSGEIAGAIPEQALIILTEQGLVVITGCAHPGIVGIVEQAQAMFAEPVHLVLGGFHLGSKSEGELKAILKDFRRLGVEEVAPCHCTGESAIKMFASEYGENFIQVGVGSVIQLQIDTQE